MNRRISSISSGVMRPMIVPELPVETVSGGFAYPETPRWHDGLLWFSDQHDGVVHAIRPDGGRVETLAVEGHPSGLGWLPDGTMLVVSMDTNRVLRRSGDAWRTHADLSGFHRHQSNDMVVDATGRAYVGNIGFDFDRGDAPAPTCLVAVEPDGRVWSVTDDLHCPNGAVITPDGGRLIIAESMASRLTVFDLQPDGALTGRQLFAPLAGHIPDGICLDAEGQIWVASPFTGSVIRVKEGGEITETVAIDGAGAYACVLGGADGRDLYICCSGSHDRNETVRLRSGRIDRTRAETPGAGW